MPTVSSARRAWKGCAARATTWSGLGAASAQARRRFPYADWIAADFHELTTPQSWHRLLSGIDAVVNCVGALQDGARDDLERVHVAAPAALFAACEARGVRRVVHVSAVGAERDGPTRFARSKGATESDLAGRDLDWVILRPGLVLARSVYGGTAMLRGVAGVPCVTPLIAAASPVHVVAIEDVAETVAWALRAGAPARLRLDLVHSQSVTTAHHRGRLPGLARIAAAAGRGAAAAGARPRSRTSPMR